jgi:hypothetical protein
MFFRLSPFENLRRRVNVTAGKYQSMKTKLTVSLLVLSLASVTPAFAHEDSSMEVVADVVAVRPVSLVATILGAALFVIALPVAATSKSIKKTADALVVRPGKATFTRPLGDYSSLDDRIINDTHDTHDTRDTH